MFFPTRCAGFSTRVGEKSGWATKGVRVLPVTASGEVPCGRAVL